LKSKIRNSIADFLWINSIRSHKSRLGRTLAPRYSSYLSKAQKTFEVDVDINSKKRGEDFRRDGWCSFADSYSASLAYSLLSKIQSEENAGVPIWGLNDRYVNGNLYQKFPEIENFFKGSIGEFLKAAYGSNFKIFSGVCYRSEYSVHGPTGSQLWHADGGPGTCINLMWYLSPATLENGAMECLSWCDSFQIFKKERSNSWRVNLEILDSLERRDLISKYYLNEINKNYLLKINQPTGDKGLVLAFRNNLIHKGGHPLTSSQRRYVCVFHIYPSVEPTPWDLYRTRGLISGESYPADPSFDDATGKHSLHSSAAYLNE